MLKIFGVGAGAGVSTHGAGEESKRPEKYDSAYLWCMYVFHT